MAPRRAPGVLAVAVAVAAALALLHLGLLRDLPLGLDLHVHDEALYHAQGQALLRGEIDARTWAWAPVLSACHALILLVPLGGLHPCDAVLFASTGLYTLGFWLVLRGVAGASAGGRLAAVLLACLLCCAWPTLLRQGMAATPSVYWFTGGLAQVAIALLLRGRLVPGLLGFALAGLNRPEAALWLMAGGAVLLVPRWRNAAPRGLPVLALALGAALLASHAGNPEGRARAWLAFRQHYAMGRAEREPVPEREAAGRAFFFPAARIEAEFGAADSILAALRANPGAVARHVAHNAALLPAQLGELAVAPARGGWLWWLAGLPLAGLLLAGLLGRPGVARCVRGEGRAVPWLIAALVGVPVALLVRPRTELLQALLLPAAAALVGIVRRAESRPWHRAAGGVEPLIPLLLAALAWAWAAPFGTRASYGLETRVAVEALRAEPRDGGPARTLLAPHGRYLPALAGCPEVEGLDLLATAEAGAPGADSLDALLGRAPDLLLVSLSALGLPAVGERLRAEVAHEERWAVAWLSPVAVLYRRLP